MGTELDLVALLLLLAHVVLGGVATVLVSANRKPSAAIAWVLMIIFVPFLGAAAFLLVGFSKLPERRREKQRLVNTLMEERTQGLDTLSHGKEWPEWLASMVALNRNLGALPMVGGNKVELIDDYSGAIQAMATEIDRAEQYVHAEFFILVHDDTTAPFFTALDRACQRGVTVRVLSDHVAGFLYPRRRETRVELFRMGAQYYPMLPLWFGWRWKRADLRNHRKLLVVDGRVGFTGSQNMIEAAYHKKNNDGRRWHELMVRLHGPAVRELNAVFVTDWFSESEELLPVDTSPVVLNLDPALFDAQVLPSGPTFANDNNLKLFAALIHNARRRVSITSPYFVPDESLLLALVTAGSRGLEVELFVSEVGDQALVHHAQRSYYEVLLRAGVRVYLYPAPTVLHAKHFTIDDDVAVIGSSNMDIRSLRLHMELSVLVHGAPFVNAIRTIQDGYRNSSTQLTLGEWLARPKHQQVRDNLARLTSSLQ